VLQRNVSQTEVRRNSSEPLKLELTQDLPGVPVLPETLLRMELMVQEPSIDLHEMAQTVLADLGATLQILRLAGREYGDAQNRPARIEDFISDLGSKACLEAVSQQAVIRDSRQRAIAAFWAHSREIAQYAKLASENMPEVNPDEAYLAGLLHAIDLLPAILGWDCRGAGPTDATLAGLWMAKKWSLPQCVVEFFFEAHLPDSETPWPGIVRTAHEVASRSLINCRFERHLRPHMHGTRNLA